MRFLAILAALVAPLLASSPSVAQNALWDVVSQLSCSRGMVISCDTSGVCVKSDVALASIVDFDKNVVYTTRIGENGTIIQPPLMEEKIEIRFNKFGRMSISFGEQAMYFFPRKATQANNQTFIPATKMFAMEIRSKGDAIHTSSEHLSCIAKLR
jgi:hypothetical protein